MFENLRRYQRKYGEMYSFFIKLWPKSLPGNKRENPRLDPLKRTDLLLTIAWEKDVCGDIF